MPEDFFISALRKSYKTPKPSVRAQKIRELVAESSETEKFIREHFPEFLKEPFPPTSLKRGGRRLVSGVRAGRAAKQL